MFDAKGNLKDWWTPEDAKEFEQRAACLADEYSSFAVVPGVYVNGKLTLGENTADNGGVRVALMALMNTLGNQAQVKIDGFTPEQRSSFRSDRSGVRTPAKRLCGCG
jgi:putative endopeptidase